MDNIEILAVQYGRLFDQLKSASESGLPFNRASDGRWSTAIECNCGGIECEAVASDLKYSEFNRFVRASYKYMVTEMNLIENDWLVTFVHDVDDASFYITDECPKFETANPEDLVLDFPKSGDVDEITGLVMP
jgi:hypothetical protein